MIDDFVSPKWTSDANFEKKKFVFQIQTFRKPSTNRIESWFTQIDEEYLENIWKIILVKIIFPKKFSKIKQTIIFETLSFLSLEKTRSSLMPEV